MNVISRKLTKIQKKGAVTSVDIANLLNARPETVSRWNQGKAFPLPDAERQLPVLEFIIEQLSDMYEPREARLWLFWPQRLLKSVSPAQLLQEGRSQEELAVVNQIRDGVYV